MQAFTIINLGPSRMKVTVPGLTPVFIEVGHSGDINADNMALVKIEDADASPQGGGGHGEE